MSNNSQIVPKRDLVSHYTNIDGLLGILSTGQLWATNIFFLNDSTELEHGKKITDEAIKNIFGELLDFDPMNPDKQRKIQLVLKAVEMTKDILAQTIEKNHSIYVCCFSEKKDQLSQWRGYSNGGIGVSIGFAASEIQRKVASQGFFLRKCIYKKKEQIEILRNLFFDAFEFFLHDQDASQIDVEDPKLNFNLTDSLHKFNFCLKLFDLLTIFKSYYFFEEAEWRLVSIPIEAPDQRINFRKGKERILPYYKLELWDQNEIEKSGINEIVISPCPEQELVKNSIENLLINRQFIGESEVKGKRIPKVSYSKIPFRSW